MKLLQHYNGLWISSINQFRKGCFEKDVWIGSPDDRRFGLTLIIRPDKKIKQAITEMLKELQELEPFQYYYPASDIHLTVMSVISCYPGFTLEGLDLVAYREQVQQAVNQISGFKIKFQGITASPSCVLVQGFPEDDSLEQLRNLLRQQFQKTNLQQSIDSRYTLRTAHCTVVRFKTDPARPAEFLATLEKYRSHNFGTSTFREVELVYNDWYQRAQLVQKLGVFELR